tara:strand:- start:1329 stop:1517 length:189 start_codon:yes stop_codon:yes gene_type:complete
VTDNINKIMKYITILDFEAGRVFQYKFQDFSDTDYEEQLTEKGHNLSNCEWMVHSDPQIITQ